MERSPFRWLLPIGVLALLVAAWHFIVTLNNLPPYVLPAPGAVLETLIRDRAVLFGSMLVTLETTALALLLAVAGGVGLALIFASARIVEFSLFPIAVILQVTPVIAVAPLMLIYMSTDSAVLLCAWIVAFFPVLSNTTLGLNSVDPNLRDLFRLAGASRWQTLALLRLPTALPYFLGGLRIAGGLALIGAVVGEIAAGSAGQGSGLAFRIVESAYRLNIPRLFAALLLISLAGILIYAVLSLLSWLALRRWHESEIGGPA
ncbi:ABC transporter permease [Starkeya koreensis]|uniref:ABC transporter permease n=1 Tax=Ancylobacter koreensis TaxID=266121 RepID=A0ABT0DLQ8_9HYPH|nr:ABC transporter permease [Ancylobacter koreensis]MCK0208208.1 ABC transporter permease [Ancylobacter koreensis]